MSDIKQPVNGRYGSHYEKDGDMYVVQGSNGAAFTRDVSTKVSSIQSQTITIGTDPVILKGGITVLANRTSLYVRNLDTSVDLYIGNNDVDSSAENGLILKAGEFIEWNNLSSTLVLYGTAASNIRVNITDGAE